MRTQIGQFVQVAGKGLLVSDRFHRPLDLDRPIVVAARESKQVPTACLAERGDDGRLAEVVEIAYRSDAEPSELFERCGTDTPEGFHRKRMKELELTTSNHLEHTNPRSNAVLIDLRLGRYRGQLGEELVRSDTDRAGEFELRQYPGANAMTDVDATSEQAK